MRILGIDPGIERTGWAVIDAARGASKALAYDCIITGRGLPLETRLVTIFTNLRRIIKTHKPRQSAIEKLYFSANVKTALTVGHARGVVLLALALENLPVFHYNPLEIKLAVSGYGRADKSQVKKMVNFLLHLDAKIKIDDVSDALAVALTHAAIKKPE